MPDNYPDLQTMYEQLGPMAGAYATGQRQQMGLQSQGLDQANLASIIQGRQLENQYNDQSMGTRLGQGQANLAQTLAGTQGQQLKNQLGAGTMDSTIAATNAGNRASMDENTAKGLQAMNQYMGQFANELNQVPVEKRSSVMAGMLQANPGLKDSPGFNAIMQMDPQQQPRALMAMVEKTNASLPSNQADMMKIKAQGDKQIQAINATGAQARATQQQAIDAGKYQRTGKAGMSLEMKIDAENDPVKKQAALIDAAQQAYQAGDEETAQAYVGRARGLDQLVRNKLSAAGAMNTTLGATGIENNTRASAVPSSVPQLGPNGPVSNAGPAKQTLASVQAQYPGVPAAKLREAYKKKFGIDLQ